MRWWNRRAGERDGLAGNAHDHPPWQGDVPGP